MRSIACAFVALLAVPAFAQDVSGGYVGASLGNLSYVERADGLVTQSDFDDSASAYRLYSGYRFGRFAVELGYAETDGIADTVTMDLGAIVPVDLSNDFTVTTLRAIQFFPIRQGRLPFVKLNLFVGAGLYDADLQSEGSIGGVGAVSVADSDNGGTAVIGLQLDLPKVSIRAEYEWFDTQSSVDLWTAGVGLVFRF